MRIAILPICAIAFILQPSAVWAQPKAEVKIDFNIVDFLKEVAKWVSDYNAYYRSQEDEKIKNSRLLLVKQLLDLAALKKSLAVNFVDFAETYNDGYPKSYSLTKIASQLQGINIIMAKIKATMSDIDPKWVVSHQELYMQFNVNLMKKETLIFENVTLFNKGAKSAEIALSVAKVFDSEAYKLVTLAKQLES